jgi:hypothetical protein
VNKSSVDAKVAANAVSPVACSGFIYPYTANTPTIRPTTDVIFAFVMFLNMLCLVI